MKNNFSVCLYLNIFVNDGDRGKNKPLWFFMGNDLIFCTLKKFRLVPLDGLCGLCAVPHLEHLGVPWWISTMRWGIRAQVVFWNETEASLQELSAVFPSSHKHTHTHCAPGVSACNPSLHKHLQSGVLSAYVSPINQPLQAYLVRVSVSRLKLPIKADTVSPTLLGCI